MNKLTNKNKEGLVQLFALALFAFFAVASVLILNKTNLSYKGSKASGNYGPYLDIAPCSGNWANNGGCFYVKNVTSNPVSIYYTLDCWDESQCSDVFATITIQPGQTVSLGLGNPCSIWQLDINWSGKTDGTWDWGGVSQISQPCGTSTPTPTATPVVTPTATPLVSGDPTPTPTPTPTPVVTPTPVCTNTLVGNITN